MAIEFKTEAEEISVVRSVQRTAVSIKHTLPQLGSTVFEVILWRMKEGTLVGGEFMITWGAKSGEKGQKARLSELYQNVQQRAADNGIGPA